MKLVSVYRSPDAPLYLYALMTEREAHVNISHRAMPTAEQHLAFVRSRPYRAWYLCHVKHRVVGAIYLSKQGEIGIFIFKAHRGHGYGKQAVKALMDKHPGNFLANINPANEASIKFFEKLGFRPMQVTYEKECAR